MRSARGFTLIELVITVAIVAILAAIAWPSYESHVLRTNRSAAKAQMLDIAAREQQFMLVNRSYADKDTLQNNGYALPSDVSTHYIYSITLVASPAAYTITFTPQGRQASDGTLTLSSDGTRSPADKWSK